MLVAGSNRNVFGIDKHAGVVVTGYAADGRQIVNRAREEAQNYKDTYGHNVIPSVLANRLSLYVHYFTLYGSLRPFGTATLVAAYDLDLQTSQLYLVEPSGASHRFFGCAAGKGANAAKTEIEKLLNKHGNSGITCREAVVELAKILQIIRDPAKDKPIELEMGWICNESNNVFEHVPKDLVKAADVLALAEVEAKGSVVRADDTGSAESEGVVVVESTENVQQIEEKEMEIDDM
jgi:20S proteasome subunit alpha 7